MNIYDLSYGRHAGARNWYANLRSRRRIELGRRALDPRPGDRILEIGCNHCAMLDALSAAGGRCVGIDVNEKMLRALGRENVLVMNAARLGFADESFDKVLAFHVFEHIPDVRGALDEVRRVLAPGGRFVFSFPLELFRGQSALKDSVVLYGHPFHAARIHPHRLTPARVGELIAGMPFAIEKSGIHFAPFPDYLMILRKTA